MLTGTEQPWDNNLYLIVFAFSIVCAIACSRREMISLWGIFLGMWVGQVAALVTIPHLLSRGWILLGIITTGIGSSLVVGAVALTQKLKADWSEGHPTR